MTAPTRWIWDDSDGAPRLRAELEEHGISWFRMPEAGALTRRPRELAYRLLGADLTIGRLDSDLIRPEPRGRSIARSRSPGPLHIDDAVTLPADVQVMVCHRQATSGGETILLDTWPVIERIEHADPQLFTELFEVARRHQGGVVTSFRPTIAWCFARLVCTVLPRADPDDDIDQRFRAHLAAHDGVEFRAEDGDVFALNNQRVLHGRRGFDGDRLFTRLLAWTTRPWPAPAGLAARAQEAAEAEHETQSVTGGPSPGAAWDELMLALACLAGEHEPEIAARHRLSRRDLRLARERVVTAGLAALAAPG